MSKDRRNTRFFWLMLILLCGFIYVAIMWATTADSCGLHAATYWQYAPPRWVCAPTHH